MPALYPDRFAGVCQLPQSPGVPIGRCIGELRRCVLELGFVGCNLNPETRASDCLPDARWRARLRRTPG